MFEKAKKIQELKRKENGFTLLEVTISISVFGLIMLSVFSFYEFQQKLIQREVVSQEVNQHGRMALNTIYAQIQENDPVLIDGDMVIAFEGDEVIPLIDFSGYTTRGKLNYQKGTSEEPGRLLGENGRIVSDHIESLSVTEEENLVDIKVTVKSGTTTQIFQRKIYLGKL